MFEEEFEEESYDKSEDNDEMCLHESCGSQVERKKVGETHMKNLR